MRFDDAIEAVLHGQPDAFLGIVRELGPMLRTYLGAQLFHQDEVEDIAQEVFVTAYRKLPNFDRSQDLGAWIRGIARNRLMKHYDAIRRRETALDRFRRDAVDLIYSDLERSASETTELRLQTLLNCIQELPDRMRTVVRGWLNGDRASSIAEELKTSVANVYQIQHRALEALRTSVEEKLNHAR